MTGYRDSELGELLQRRVGMFGKRESEGIGKTELNPAGEKTRTCSITSHTEVIRKKSRQKTGW